MTNPATPPPGTTQNTTAHPVLGALPSHPDPNATLYLKVNPPLSASQKNIMGQYLKDAGGYTDADIAFVIHNLNPSSPDAGLIAMYNGVATGGVFNTSPSGVYRPGLAESLGITSVTDFLNRLWSTISSGAIWLRVGEIVLGLILIGVGVRQVSPTAAQFMKAPPGNLKKLALA